MRSFQSCHTCPRATLWQCGDRRQSSPRAVNQVMLKNLWQPCRHEENVWNNISGKQAYLHHRLWSRWQWREESCLVYRRLEVKMLNKGHQPTPTVHSCFSYLQKFFLLLVCVSCFIQSAYKWFMSVFEDAAWEIHCIVFIYFSGVFLSIFCSWLARSHTGFFRTWMGHSMSPFRGVRPPAARLELFVFSRWIIVTRSARLPGWRLRRPSPVTRCCLVVPARPWWVKPDQHKPVTYFMLRAYSVHSLVLWRTK